MMDRRMQFAIAVIGAVALLLATIIAGVFNLFDGESAPQDLRLAVTCNGLRPEMRSGDSIELTYAIEVSADAKVGLGAGLYNTEEEEVVDHSDGRNDLDHVQLKEGGNTNSRPFVIPAGVPPGHYELTGEVWPAGKIGHENVDAYDDQPCGEFNIVS